MEFPRVPSRALKVQVVLHHPKCLIRTLVPRQTTINIQSKILQITITIFLGILNSSSSLGLDDGDKTGSSQSDSQCHPGALVSMQCLLHLKILAGYHTTSNKTAIVTRIGNYFRGVIIFPLPHW